MGEDDRDGWSKHADEQRRSWLRLSHHQRLLWLEQAKRFADQALAAARERRARTVAGGRPPASR